MIQPILSPCESFKTDLSVFLNPDLNILSIYLGTALLEQIRASSQSFNFKMLLGRLRNAGVTLSALQKSFGHDNRTIKKWANAILLDNVDDLEDMLKGRDHKRKVTPDMHRYIVQQYRILSKSIKNYRQVIIEKVHEVFETTLSKGTVSAIFKECNNNNDVKKSCVSSVNMHSNEQTSIIPSTDLSLSDHNTTITKLIDIKISDMRLIRHGGLILLVPFMNSYNSMNRQLIMQLLSGAVNIEQSKALCFDSLKVFHPESIVNLRSQRERIKEESSADMIIEMYRKNDTIIQDGPSTGKVFYFDTHTKKYTGQVKIMKDWCGSAHSVEKVGNMECFHTIHGRPCFIQIFSPYYDMRERFFMALDTFNKVCGENITGRTFVIDRGIYGLEVMSRFENDYLITWEKGYDRNGWDENADFIEFTKGKLRNSLTDLKKYHFQCQEIVWHRSDKFRKIIVKATNHKNREIEVSILCSNPHLEIEDIVWNICNRWMQENDFKYLNKHFGINQLDSNTMNKFKDISEELEDKDVVTIEYKKAKKSIKLNENKLAKSLLKEKKSRRENDKLCTEKILVEADIKSLDNKKIEELDELKKKSRKIKRRIDYLTKDDSLTKIMIEDLEKKIEKESETLVDIIHKESKIERLVRNNYSVLNTEIKSYIDAARINASNIFRNLHDQYRKIRNNTRDDHFWLRELTRCSAFVKRKDGQLIVQLWLPGSFQKQIIKEMQILIDNYKELSTHHQAIKIELIQGTISV